MNKSARFISCLILSVGLAACRLPVGPPDASPNQEIVAQYQMVSSLLTQTARAGEVNVRTPSPLAATVAFMPPVPIPTLTYTPTQSERRLTQTGGLAVLASCDLASAGRPLDVTVPDDTRLEPGQYFSKTWRLVNAGSCSWDGGYSVVWFSGEDLGVTQSQRFSASILPGQSVEITVDMQAPLEPGSYQSNWKLRNSQGALFGIGPGGGAPFWVRIVVVPVETETPLPTREEPTPTSTPEIFAMGEIDLAIDTGIDLDSGQINQLIYDDLFYETTAEGLAELRPENGARLMTYGAVAPQLVDCSSAPLTATPVRITDIQPGLFLCFRTTEGLPGRMTFSEIDLENQRLTIEFVIWVVP
jgi:hypothetical protein